MIGNGALLDKTRALVERLGLQGNVILTGAMPAAQVREEMEKAQIMITTSDEYEGWGVVVNEAMSSACTVIASHLMGSVPFLLKDGENGLVYRFGNEADLYNKVTSVMDNRAYGDRLARNAYDTICDMWSAENAATRLMSIIQDMISNREINFYEDGPCSRAQVIKPKISRKGT